MCKNLKVAEGRQDCEWKWRNTSLSLSLRHWLSCSFLGRVIAWLEGKETQSAWEVREKAFCFWKLSISWPLGSTASFHRNEGHQNEYNLTEIKSERLEFTNLERANGVRSERTLSDRLAVLHGRLGQCYAYFHFSQSLWNCDGGANGLIKIQLNDFPGINVISFTHLH